jgi:hypothetical protein
MKKTFLAMLLAGSTMTLFAQTTPTNTPTNTTGSQTNPTTNSPNTTQQSAGVTGDPSTSKSQDVTNMSNINTWNGVRSNSTSWSPEKEPSWGWNSYGVWNGSANWNANSNNPNGNTTTNNTGMNGTSNMNNNMNTGDPNVNNQQSSANMNSQANNKGWNNQNNMNSNTSMNSTGSYSAYGTTVPYLPSNVQTRFGQDYPANTSRTYSWHQYGDWFHTHQMDQGRYTQYFYDTRGNGYSLALPVLLSYVPENIVNSALNKYGSNLYSISMVKTNDGKDNYMIGLLDRGQISTQYLDESGVTVNDVWRTEDYGTMQSTQSNAAMGDGSSMNNNMNGNTNSNMNSDMNGNMNNNSNTDMNQNKSNQSNWDAKKEGKKEYHDKKKNKQMQ